MKIKKLFLIIPLLSLLILPTTFASAACVWRDELTTNNPELSGSQTTGGCISNEKQPTSVDAEKCSGGQPAASNGLFTATRSVCCCSVTPAAPISKEPLIKVPIPEITIPTVKLSEVKCVPNSKGEYSCAIPWIGEYINGLYQYGINIAGILAAIVLMAGGLLWLISGGDASKITQAKDMIIGSITGLLILLCAYIILTQINPDLVKMKSITMGYVDKDITPTPENAVDFLLNCKSTDTGPCAVANMFGFGTRNYQASAICMAESSGNPAIPNKATSCGEGPMLNGYAVWGLFQFNLSANVFVDKNGKTLNCPKAFDKEWTNSSPSCKVINQSLYDACVAAAITPELSILNAQNLVNAAGGWGPWEANSKKCHF